jgi:hypothetical protein
MTDSGRGKGAVRAGLIYQSDVSRTPKEFTRRATFGGESDAEYLSGPGSSRITLLGEWFGPIGSFVCGSKNEKPEI